MKEFIKRLLCRHGPWRIVAIGYDGCCTVACKKCGKIKSRPL